MGTKSMPVATANSGKCRMIMIDGSLTIYEVSELQTKLLEYLKSDNKFLVNLSKVESCDSAGVQLICSFVKEIELQGGTASLEGYSETVLTMFNKIGVNITTLFQKKDE